MENAKKLTLLVYNAPFRVTWDRVSYIYSPSKIKRKGRTVRFTSSAFGMFDQEILMVPEDSFPMSVCGLTFNKIIWWGGNDSYKQDTITYASSRVR